MDTTRFLSMVQAAYISGLTERQLNRIVDQCLVPAELIVQSESERLISVLGAAFASFNFASTKILSAACRKGIIRQAHEVIKANGKNSTFIDEVISGRSSLEFQVEMVKVDLSPVLCDVSTRLSVMCAAENLIVQDQSVMSGRPVFKGTRVPIDLVVDSSGRGLGLQEAQLAYSFLTQDHLDAAVTYVKLYPTRGWPRSLAEANPTLKRLGTTGE